MIGIFLITKQGTYELPVESVTWKGSKFNAARSIDVTLPTVRSGYHTTFFPENGDAVVFKWKGQERFRGTVFVNKDTRSRIGRFTAYDQLIYLLKSKDDRVLSKKKASDVVKMFCTELQLSMGTIADTGYVVPSHVMDGESFYDTIIRYLVTTYKRTGVKHYLYSMGGKVHLVKRLENPHKWVIENGVNLVDWSYEKSIEEIATRVKLQTGEDKETITALANDATAQKKFGIIQHYEKVPDKMNKGQLQAKANQILKNKSKEEKIFTLDAVGLPDVISGGSCYVIVKELGVARGYYIDEDVHAFEGKEHIMSLTLQETDDLPEIEGVNPYQPPQTTGSKGSGGKYNSTAAKAARDKVKELGLTITSAGRSKAHNKAVGGSPGSYHLKNQAYDVAGSYKKMDEFAKWARESDLFVEVLWKTKGHWDHVHVAWS